jgi:hypothetical protein
MCGRVRCLAPWLLASVTMAVPALAAQTASGHSDAMSGSSFLVGDWEGVGGGGPGKGAGAFSFQRDLQQQVLVRRNHAEYPAAEGRPAVVHDDLMVVYSQGEAATPRAIYFDSEGHVIHYSVQLDSAAVPAEHRSVTFISDAAPGSPRYRLTYRMTGADTVEIKFEIAPPARPDAFAPYITASAHRKPGR